MEAPHDLNKEKDDILINISKELHLSHMSIKQECNENNESFPVKPEILNIKPEIKDSESTDNDMQVIKHEFCALSPMKREEHNFSSDVNRIKPQKSFSCTFCPYKCVRKTYLTDHLRTHTRDKPYGCTLCDYKCATNSHMTRHLKTHSEEKPYSCTLCNFKSSWKECLNNHLKAHVNEKPHSCNICNYKSVKKSNLIRHMAKHNRDNKPYRCNDCEFKSSRKLGLVEHERLHTREKYNCTEYISPRKESLSCHLKTHRGKVTEGNKSENNLNEGFVKIEELYIKEEF